MLYPENIDDKLGFAEIRRLLSAYCLSSMGRERVANMRLLNNVELLKKLLQQVAEFKKLLQDDAAFPSSDYLDVRPWLKKMKPENAFLSLEEVFQLSLMIKTVFQIIRYMQEREEEYPALAALFEGLSIEKQLPALIDGVLNDKGAIRPDASPDLATLMQQIRRAELEAGKRLDNIFRQAVKEGWVSDGNLTVRGGRMVIPVQAEYKRKLKGYIHDESASGQTVFIEPAEVVELNNRLRDLESEKQREITRILIELTAEIKPFAPQLNQYGKLLATIDFIRAKALLAIRLDAQLPRLLAEPVIRLVDARHPLLWLAHREQGQVVIPLTLSLGEEEARIIVLSGPNAGGKSVCLKTVGLLQMMLQRALLIPASEFSEIGIVQNILAEIGDDQSIESDLSTYSAHLSKMKAFISQAGPGTLVLIDEFGTGTDPQFGGPLAEAVLEELNRKAVKGVITTHYSNLKLFAGNTDGLQNASMLFDNKALRPLYRLEMGKPGSSYAFEIAEKIGLPRNVLSRAREKAGAEQNYLDRLLVELEHEKKSLLDKDLAISRKQQELDHLLAENRELKQHFDMHRKQLLKAAREEARGIISGANKLVENTISEIKQSGAEKEATRQARQRLKEAGGRLADREKQSRASSAARDIVPGSWVKLRGSDSVGEVLSVSRGNVVLAMGDLRTVAKLNQLERVNKAPAAASRKSASHHVFQQSEQAKFSHEVNFRGMRGEEALAELEKVMDRALMLGVGKLRIIHGKGDGVLRKLVRDYLRDYPQVSKLEDEHPDMGGDGITYVYLD